MKIYHHENQYHLDVRTTPWSNVTWGWWARAARRAPGSVKGPAPSAGRPAEVWRLPAPAALLTPRTCHRGQRQTLLRLLETPRVSASAQGGQGKTACSTSTCLCCPHQDLSLLFVLSLFLNLIKLFKKFELSPDITCLLVSVIILEKSETTVCHELGNPAGQSAYRFLPPSAHSPGGRADPSPSRLQDSASEVLWMGTCRLR